MMEYTTKDYIDGFLYLCIMLSPLFIIIVLLIWSYVDQENGPITKLAKWGADLLFPQDNKTYCCYCKKEIKEGEESKRLRNLRGEGGAWSFACMDCWKNN